MMNINVIRGKINYRTFAPVMLALLLLLGLIFLPTGYEGALTYQNAERVKAEVMSTDESDVFDTGLLRTGEQRCVIRILEGRFEGQKAEAVNRLSGSLEQDKIFAVGDVVFVAASHKDGAITYVSMTDHYRMDKEALLAGIFLLLLVTFAGKTGLRAILSFVVTILMMWKVLVGIRLVNQGNMTTGILLRALQVVTVPALGYSSQQGGETHRSLVRRKGLVGLSTIPTAASAAILRRAEAATRAGTILRFAPNPAIPCDISCDMAF